MTFDFTEYIHQVAIKLKGVLHSDTGSDKRFFRISNAYNMDELLESLSSTGTPCIAAEDNIMGRIIEPGSSNFENNRNYSFMVLAKCNYSDAADRQEKKDYTWTLVKRIFAKMKKDYLADQRGTKPSTGLRNLDWNSVFYQTVGPFGDNFIGILVQFSMLTPMNSDLVYDETYWS